VISRRGFLKTLGGGFAALMALGGYAVAEPLWRPRITRTTLTPNGWPLGLKLRIAMLADFHACEPWMPAERIASICEMANELQPDVVCLLGDYVSGMRLVTSYVSSADWAQALKILKAPLGVHAVLGNHDYWEDLRFQRSAGAGNIATEALRGVGIRTYINEVARLEKDGHSFWLAGPGDQLALRPGQSFGRKRMSGIDDLPGTMAQIKDASPIILMAHEPDIFPQVSSRVGLTLSGHTHGGQVDVFGWRPVAASRGSRRYPAGHFREGARDLIVSRGLGCSGLPIRFGVPPEINLIELG